MQAYDIQHDVTEWIDECGGAQAAERYLNDLANRFAKAGEANKAHHYRKLAHEMRRIINSPDPVVVRRRRNAR
jgi:plasmid stabilization system protein ParE